MHEYAPNDVIIIGSERCGKSIIANIVADAHIFPTKACFSGLWGISAARKPGESKCHWVDGEDVIPEATNEFCSQKQDERKNELVWLSRCILKPNHKYTCITELSTAAMLRINDNNWFQRWSSIASKHIAMAGWLVMVVEARGVSRNALQEFGLLLKHFPSVRTIPERRLFINCLNTMTSESALEVAQLTKEILEPYLNPVMIKPQWPMKFQKDIGKGCNNLLENTNDRS